MKRHFLIQAPLVATLAGIMTMTVSSSASAALFFSVENGNPSNLPGNDILADPNATSVRTLNDVDEVDGFSFSEFNDILFRLCFSVDSASQGLANTHVRTEANNQEQMGDAFLSRKKYTRSGFNSGSSGHDLAIDEENLGIVPGDELDGASSSVNGATNPIYFTQAGNVSGADIFLNSTSTTFALASFLGLESEDDIDALVVWDDDKDGSFNGTDQVLFSLGIDSAAKYGVSAADILTINAGENLFSVFATAADLGLRSEDNVDALELVADTGKPVPEPAATLGIFGVSLLGVLIRRKKNNSSEN